MATKFMTFAIHHTITVHSIGKTLIQSLTNGLLNNTSTAYNILHPNVSSRLILMPCTGQTHAYWCFLAVAVPIQKPVG